MCPSVAINPQKQSCACLHPPKRVWARLRYFSDVYDLYGLALIVPPLVLVFCA